MSAPRAVGLLGGGVIGGGWAARFLLGGTDVRLYDPDPESGRRLAETLELARRAVRRLSPVALPREGCLTLVPTPAAAAEGVELVQESAPERLELKQALLAEAATAAGPEVLIASSTSGLRPTALAAGMAGPERFLVAHPFNPVYLLPLVELCGGERTAPETIERARGLYESLGMAPLVVRKEIDGFVADRMLEALWREALWLVNDGVATVAEVDDAIRLGAGLRWSFMGTFLTYRIAGGEAGMRHFMAQFGPALQWPWTKLMDVPDLTDALLDTIVAQSDEQADGQSVRELEQQLKTEPRRRMRAASHSLLSSLHRRNTRPVRAGSQPHFGTENKPDLRPVVVTSREVIVYQRIQATGLDDPERREHLRSAEALPGFSASRT
jgi:carnitine 3-dehydrogenase